MGGTRSLTRPTKPVLVFCVDEREERVGTEGGDRSEPEESGSLTLVGEVPLSVSRV